VICIDQMGPESAKSFAGQAVVTAHSCAELVKPAERARIAIDYGRRGKGYIFGAFRPASGEALTRDYRRRTIVN